MKSFLWLVSLVFTVCLYSDESVWETAQELAPGIRFLKLALETPRPMKGAIVRVDTKTPDLQFHLTGRDPDWGKIMPDEEHYIIRTFRQTTRDFLLEFEQKNPDRDMIVAVNSAPWSPFRKPFTHKYADRLGLLVSDGVLVCEPARTPSFVIWKDGTMEFRYFSDGVPLEKIRHAVSGFAIILKNGKILDGAKDLHPRTAFGLSADSRYFFILVIDGRQPDYSLGADYRDLAELLLQFGASEGINMDGGGSTTLFTHEPGSPSREKIIRQNRFSGERHVGANLGISLKRGSRK